MSRRAGPVLALDASTAAASVALIGPAGEPWGVWKQAAGLRGTTHLAVAAGALLAARGLSPAELAGVTVGTGPGSYTGTRAAIALARGLALPGAVPVAGVPSTAAAARAALRSDPRLRRVVVLIDARRGECYRADYERSELPPGLVERHAPRLVADPDAMPAQEDFAHPEVGPLLDKYLRGAQGTTTERMRVLRLIESMTLGTTAVPLRTEAMHGAGSPQAQRVRIAAQANFEEKIAHARRIAGADNFKED